MALTFDEALKAIDEKSDMEPYSGLFLIEIEDAKAIVMKLANTYAPTIEMTQKAYNELNDLRSHNRDLDGVLSHAMLPYNPLIRYTTEDLAQAWLHPETVKVVE